MKHVENSKMYEADDGKMLVRKYDNKIIGDGICLGDNDDISNYDEYEFTPGQRAQFFKDIGMEDPKKRKSNAYKDKYEKKHTPFRTMKE